MSTTSIIPVILCGGTGSRLWPLSRKSYPKQFLSISSVSSQSLLQNTYERIKNLKGLKEPILICNEEHRFIVAEQMREINIKPRSILLEPFGRNTAPAVTLAALISKEFEKDAQLLILSSDHIIEDEKQFLKVINAGIKYANEGRLVTFGVIPDEPSTGYGYIKSAEPLEESEIKGSSIESFIEKPNLITAKELIKDKKYSWNSGMFLFKANAILNEIKHFTPEVLYSCKKSLEGKLFDLDFQRLDQDSFYKCPNISIDVAVMEKTINGTVLPLKANWTDIGSWNAVWKISKKDESNNYIEGSVIAKNSHNCYLRGEKRLIAALGVRNLIVIETSDAILVADKSQSQEVKNIVNSLKERGIREGQEHKKIYRPWGSYESIIEEKDGK